MPVGGYPCSSNGLRPMYAILAEIDEFVPRPSRLHNIRPGRGLAWSPIPDPLPGTPRFVSRRLPGQDPIGPWGLLPGGESARDMRDVPDPHVHQGPGGQRRASTRGTVEQQPGAARELGLVQGAFRIRHELDKSARRMHRAPRSIPSVRARPSREHPRRRRPNPRASPWRRRRKPCRPRRSLPRSAA